ncbi:MAG: cysteine--tRNA ligase [Candidatus Nanoarchaeia archaeon]|nr:cysteine--tRNA ligase [Candidatus Nanoarchaeia archaeon]MDD5239231.1 cysteine--tRNA ligase [Candidatus Nanoarchaeia archaeon]
MVLKVYNTLTKKKETFKPLNQKEVRMYVCGPTIYNFAHIGNFRAYLFADILRRYLKYSGYAVKEVMNLTDVDDKTIRDSRRDEVPLKQFTAKYEKAFIDDMRTLNIEKPEVMPKATEHIKEMVELVKKLIAKGIAYKGEDGSVYYSIKKFKEYGKLSGVDLASLKAGARVKQDDYEKEQAQDFVLWKAWDDNDGDVYWNTEIGKGRPGWHLECSAMSMKYLGETFDIHTGGIDLIFPHHENEIAQSEGATGKKFVNFWLHNAWVLVDGKKMSKRFGNFYTPRDLFAKGYSSKALRYLLMNAQYRTELNFTETGLKDAETTVQRMIQSMDRLDEAKATGKYSKELEKSLAEAKEKFEDAMNDDLNTPLAFAGIHELITKTNKALDENSLDKKNVEEIKKQMERFDTVLGVLEHEKEKVSAEIKKLVEEREKARTEKDFKKSDKIRESIKALGWDVQDTPDGQKVRKAN